LLIHEERWTKVPGKQLVDPIDRMFGNAGQYMAQVCFGIELIELRGADQRVDGRGALTAASPTARRE